jgi:hypothetical protein
MSARACRGCGAPIETDADALDAHRLIPAGNGGRAPSGQRPASLRYCLACREAFCTTCQRRGGTHRDDCPRGRPPRERPVFGIVSAEDVAALYVEHYAALVRVAARYYAPIGAKDCVQDVTEWLLAHRAYLDRPLTAALFFAAVRNRALREWHYGRVMFEQPLDPDDLLAVEERLDAERWGHPRVAAVRLPDADAVT